MPVFFCLILFSDRQNVPNCKASTIEHINVIARRFVAIFEGELGNAGFVEIAGAFGDHAVAIAVRADAETMKHLGLRERLRETEVIDT